MAYIGFGRIATLYLILINNVHLKGCQQNMDKLYNLYFVKRGKKHIERFDCLSLIEMILFS